MFFTTDFKILLQESEKNLKASTIQSFENMIKRVYVSGLGVSSFDVKLLKTKLKKVIKFIESDELNLNVKRNTLNAIKNVLAVSDLKDDKELYKVYNSMFYMIAKDAEKARNYAKATEDELDNKPTKDEIKDLFKGYEKEIDKLKYDWSIDIPYLFLGFLVYLPVLRSQDYVSLRIIEKSSEWLTYDNYVNLEDGIISISNYKTDKTHGVRTIDIPSKLMKIIRTYYNKTDNEILFPQKNNSNLQLSTSGFTHFINNVFGRKVSIQVLRQWYVSTLQDSGISISKRKKIADIMGHSVQTSLSKYGKYSDFNNK